MTAVGIVASAAGGIEDLCTGLVEPLLDRGLTVAVTLTPTAAICLDALDEITQLEKVTDLPVRTQPRLPGQVSPHPRIDAYIAAPSTANTIAKLALGIADNQALTVLCENIGTDTPMVVFPRVNAAHSRQPAWNDHLERLRRAGVHLIYGQDVWPLFEPRAASGHRELPWSSILAKTVHVCTAEFGSLSIKGRAPPGRPAPVSSLRCRPPPTANSPVPNRSPRPRGPSSAGPQCHAVRRATYAPGGSG